MARIRTIKPEIWTSDQFVECSWNARLLFIGVLNFADDAGRHPASAKRAKMEVFPGDDLTTEVVEELATELIDNGLWVEYESQGKKYWQVTGWDRHQKVDRPNIKFRGPFDEGSTIVRGTLDDHSPPEGSLRESKGKERKGREGSKVSTSDYSEGFLKFWEAFPSGRRTKKPDAWQAYQKAIEHLTPVCNGKPNAESYLHVRAAEYAESDQGKSPYVRGPTPWLNQQAWEDSPDAWREKSNGKRNDLDFLND